jgi:hypothetical protein
MLDLTSTYAKLGRAEDHYKIVDDEIRTWINSGDNTFTVERGAYDTRFGIVVHFHEPKPDFLRWTLMIADCVFNLRCALDHLVYAVGKLETRENPTSDVDKNYFVIADTEPEFWGESKKKLRGLSCTVVSAIERLQPYRRPHPIIPPALNILRRFSNADKHRLLQMAGAGIAMGNVTVIGDPARGRKFVYLIPEPVNDNDVICVIESTEADPDLALHDARIGMEIALWHGLREGETNPMRAHSGYSALIPLIISEVKFVIDQIKAVCP